MPRESIARSVGWLALCYLERAISFWSCIVSSYLRPIFSLNVYSLSGTLDAAKEAIIQDHDGAIMLNGSLASVPSGMSNE